MGSGERIFAGVFGALLLGVGVYVLLFGVVPALWKYLTGAVLVALGANAVLGAFTGKRPWISRIGPLP